jgi:NitT/TauT family transport system ATP-binding protein
VEAKPPEIISVRNVTRTFSTGDVRFNALEDVSLSIDAGRFVSIVGPSGCGKSTLLQIVAGLTAASSGDVQIEGQGITGPSPDKIGVVFQEPLLLPWKTAAENIEFPMALQGVAKPLMQKRSAELLSLVGLSEFGDSYPHQLSGGMKQRVAIARGLVRNPPLLLMDEPFAALDEQTRTKMWAELLRIVSKSQSTVMFVTHGLVEAVYLADEVLVMGSKPGRIIERIFVDLPRPRTLDMLGSPELGGLRNRIWSLIAGSVP